MFYSYSWKSGFLTGLITGITIYALARTSKGRGILDNLKGITGVVKDGVNALTKQTTDVLDGAVQVADSVAKQEAQRDAFAATSPTTF